MRFPRWTALYFGICLTLLGPEGAFGSIRVDSIRHNARVPGLPPGARLEVTVEGTAGCQGSYSILGFSHGMLLEEMRPGIYRGEFLVPPGGLPEQPLPLVVNLRKPDRRVQKEASEPVLFRPAPESSAVSVSPPPGRVVPADDLNLRFVFGKTISADTVEVWLDGRPCRTPLTLVDNSFRCPLPGSLEAGPHRARVEAPSVHDGQTLSRTWTFRVRETTADGDGRP